MDDVYDNVGADVGDSVSDDVGVDVGDDFEVDVGDTDDDCDDGDDDVYEYLKNDVKDEYVGCNGY